jgi:putative addiction module component (TIGR02574 family)
MTKPNQSSAPRTVEEIFHAALKLSPEEREKLACMLEDDLQNPDSWYATPEIAQAWNKEIARRIKLMDEGKMEMIAADEVHRRLRKIIATTRAGH